MTFLGHHDSDDGLERSSCLHLAEVLPKLKNVSDSAMLHRREFLQVGSSTFFGLTLPALLGRQAAAATTDRRAKSVVLVFLTGGGAHLDTFDPKPDVADVRGEFQAIPTRVPGIQFTEILPKLADRANRLAVVRSMAHNDNRHLSGTHNTLTGAIQPFRGSSNLDKSLNRSDWPCYGSAVKYLRPLPNGLPGQVTLPRPLFDGTTTWPAQHAGFLGPKYDPFQLNEDLNEYDFQVSGLCLPDGLSIGRLDRRFQLLREMERRQENLNESPSGQAFTRHQQAAYSMLTSGTLKKALRIQDESPKNRERYGHHDYGQILLLARRLVEAEIPVIQCTMGRVNNWDTHYDHFPLVKSKLPKLDQSLSTFLDDLVDRGLLDQTLVVCVGEFGRTPKIWTLPGRKLPGRHHWSWGYSAVFAGGGVQGGQVIGKTDRVGGYPVTVPFHPNDMGATIYDSLGIDPATQVHDRLARPHRLNYGKVMDGLFSGA